MTAKQIQAKLKKLGLINDDGTPVLYSQFKNRASVIRYGKTQKKIAFIGQPKDNLFGFYPKETAHDSIVLKNAYKQYVQLVRGNIDAFVAGDVQWGNGGFPSTYGNIPAK